MLDSPTPPPTCSASVQPVIATTATQYALGVCFLVLAPALAIAAAYLQWQREENMAFGAIVTGAAAWSGWVVSCVIAAVLFPGYPASGVPPEPVAMLFTLPGAATGGLCLAWLAARRTPTRGSRNVLMVLCATLTLATALSAWALVALHLALTTPYARQELPESAVILSEEEMADSFIGDFTYNIDARMSEADFHGWMDRLGLRPLPGEPLRYERPGSNQTSCGAVGSYSDGVGHFGSWCG